MKRLLPAVLFLSLGLAACVDTTGLSKDSSKGPTGNPDAVVTVTEFGDIQCPACGSAYTMIEQPLLQKYPTQIRFEFKHFPLQTIHPYALELAMASECAADQGKFWEFIDAAYVNQKDLAGLGRNASATWAGKLGIDMDLFDRCLKSKIKKDAVLADYDEGEKLGVRGTPTFFVNGQQVNASVADISTAIDKELSAGAGRF